MTDTKRMKCSCGGENVTKIKNRENAYACHDCGRIFLTDIKDVDDDLDETEREKGYTAMKDVKTAPLTEEDLQKTAGGVQISPDDSDGKYKCSLCGKTEFYIIDNTPKCIILRCKNCNAVSYIQQ